MLSLVFYKIYTVKSIKHLFKQVPEEAKGLPWLQNQEPEVIEEPEEDMQPKIVCKFGAPAEDPNRPKSESCFHLIFHDQNVLFIKLYIFLFDL